MKLLKFISLATFLLILNVNLYSQDNTATPEYEATKQTEKMQQELNLSTDQVKLVYEINLRYARARQSSTSRAEAMERLKNKDADLEHVLKPEQVNRLQNKRYERSGFQSVNPSNFRQSTDNKYIQTNRQQISNPNLRNEIQRNSETMRTLKPSTFRANNQQTNRVTPPTNNQQYERNAVPPARSGSPPTQSTSPPTQSTTQRSGTSGGEPRTSSGSNRR